ncbi:helix-turn-helix domain-containing protein [Thalassobacillus devorans]|uniref:helix-turn-helix domain-containing protein n=1 Tax=Thalassobacillus devorans TaxID=279813 RepID=UPI00048C3BB0|nr:helix-turn-helix domain-containing protein [Thalassobacillus devorans]
MDQSAIISNALDIFYLSKLNTYVLNQNEEVIFGKEGLHLPLFMSGAQFEDTYHASKHTEQEVVYYTNDWGVNYLTKPVYEEEEKYLLIIGPFLNNIPNIYHLSRDYKITANERNELADFLSQCKILNETEINSLIKLLKVFDHMMMEDAQASIVSASKQPQKLEVKKFDQEQDTKEVNLRYKIESDIMHAVEQGDKEKLKAAIKPHQALFTFPDRFPNQPLRRLKNLSIVYSTIMRVAAKNAQVPAPFLDQISETYVLRIEAASQLSELQKIQDEMEDNYCELVSRHSLSRYSPTIQKALEYLGIFYDKPMDTEQISAYCFAHKSHLARKFKQETGSTMTEYQQKIRIQEAIHLLENETMKIDEIAWAVGYEDPAYFSRIFKKETGVTPRNYRQQSQ